MIVHVMPYQKAFTLKIINFIKNNAIGDHFFYVFCLGSLPIKMNIKNVKYICLNRNNLHHFFSAASMVFVFFSLIIKNKKIIFHGLFLPKIFFLLMLFIPKTRKSYWNWIVFGGDMYDRRNYMAAIPLCEKMFLKLKTSQVRQFGYITTLTKGDYELAKKYYGVCGHNYVVIYGHPKRILSTLLQDLPEKNNLVINESNTDRIIKILIGNSATRDNHHEEIIKILSKYSNEKLEIYIPLSYGDPSYALEIENLGKETFGQKFFAVKNFLEYQDYISFLRSIDVAIFNNDRQQALGNINVLNGLGKKVYIREDTTMWEHFRDCVKVKLNSARSIEMLQFKDFVYYDDKERAHNIESTVAFFKNEENSIEVWNNIFMDMENGAA